MSSPSSTVPKCEVLFDGGDPVELAKHLTYVDVIAAANPQIFVSETQRVAFSVSGLRGVAIEWIGTTLAADTSLIGPPGDWRKYKAILQDRWGQSGGNAQRQAQLRLAQLEFGKDLTVFQWLSEIEALAAAIGSTSDVSMLTIVMLKVPQWAREKIYGGGGNLNTWKLLRDRIIVLDSAGILTKPGKKGGGKKKPKCGNCGKKGHSAAECTAKPA